MLFKPRTRLLPALTVLLSLLGLACGGGEEAIAPPTVPASTLATADALKELELEAYNKSSFNICDVKVLSAFWGSMENDTKSTISAKILSGGEELVTEALSAARYQALGRGAPECTFDELGYTPADARAVADNWGYDLSEAKAAMFNKYLNGGKEGLAEEVQRSHGVALERANMAEGEEGEQGAPWEPIDAFDEFSNYCEAKMLGHLFGSSVWDAKLLIGAKHLTGHGELVAEQMYRAYQSDGAPGCDWSDVHYSYEDAEAMAKYWGMSVTDTKSTMVSKVRVGNRSYLESEMAASR
jgi:hypothetical protein